MITHCKRGHEFTPENTRHRPRQRVCIACQRERNVRKYAEIRQFLNSLKEGRACADCKGSFPPCVLDFHHRDPSTKRFGIGSAGTSYAYTRAEVIAETEKCDLVCSNCHRVRHHGAPE